MSTCMYSTVLKRKKRQIPYCSSIDKSDIVCQVVLTCGQYSPLDIVARVLEIIQTVYMSQWCVFVVCKIITHAFICRCTQLTTLHSLMAVFGCFYNPVSLYYCLVHYQSCFGEVEFVEIMVNS